MRGRPPAAILDRETYEALTAAAEERHRAAVGHPLGPVAGLLAGLAVCGRCGAPLRRGGPAAARVYRCPGGRRLGAGRLSCGRLQVNAAALEEHVAARALAAWAADDAPYRAAGPPQVRAIDAELAALAAAAGHLEEQHRTGLLTPADHARLRARSAERQALLRRRRDAAAAAGLPAARGQAIYRWWDGAGSEARHALIGAVYPAIRIRPAARPGAGRGGEAIDPARVELAPAPPVPAQQAPA